MYQALRSRDGLLAAHLDRREIEALIERHRSGFEDATDRLWRLINLQLWGDLFLTGRREQVFNSLAVQEAVRPAL